MRNYFSFGYQLIQLWCTFKSRRDLGAHSNPGEVAFQFDDLHLILEKLLCGKAYSKGVSLLEKGVSFLENILK